MNDLTPTIDTIIETYRTRRDILQFENGTILRMRAVCRRHVAWRANTQGEKIDLAEVRHRADALYDALNDPEAHPDAFAVLAHLQPAIESRDGFHRQRLEIEKRLRKLARSLPVWPFVEGINGFGDLGLAIIVGETGDLHGYANPGKVWKRMGLAPFKGSAMSSWRAGRSGSLNAEEWTEAGYSPNRRSAMFTIGDSLLKKQNRYRELYLARKAFEQAKVPDGTKMLWHRRAQRYVEKRLLRDLWRAWRNLPLEYEQAA